MTDVKNMEHPIPEGYTSVTPFVIAKGAAEFIDFMKKAFDGVKKIVIEDFK